MTLKRRVGDGDGLAGEKDEGGPEERQRTDGDSDRLQGSGELTPGRDAGRMIENDRERETESVTLSVLESTHAPLGAATPVGVSKVKVWQVPEGGRKKGVLRSDNFRGQVEKIQTTA